jgi:molecular chaperone GrpE
MTSFTENVEDEGIEEAHLSEENDVDAELGEPAELAELNELKDRYARLQAEWDNYRKRTENERASERRRATEKLVERLLPILDDMERALEHGESSSPEAVLEGIAAVNQKLSKILEGEGLKAINPEGDAFDGTYHQAVATVDDADIPHETVKEVYQKGYIMGDKVLRPAMVTVSKGGAEREKEE